MADRLHEHQAAGGLDPGCGHLRVDRRVVGTREAAIGRDGEKFRDAGEPVRLHPGAEGALVADEDQFGDAVEVRLPVVEDAAGHIGGDVVADLPLVEGEVEILARRDAVVAVAGDQLAKYPAEPLAVRRGQERPEVEPPPRIPVLHYPLPSRTRNAFPAAEPSMTGDH